MLVVQNWYEGLCGGCTELVWGSVCCPADLILLLKTYTMYRVAAVLTSDV